MALFLKTAIDKAKFGKYGYGYKFSQKRIERQTILLPIDKKGEPNWKYMESYVKQKLHSQAKQIISYYEN